MKKISVITFLLNLGVIGAFCQDTLNYLYQRSRVADKVGSIFIIDESNIFISEPIRMKGYSKISVHHDTAKYEIHWKGMKRELFNRDKYVTDVDYIIAPLGTPQYRFTIDNVTYLLKREKGELACYSGDNIITSINFYKDKKDQIVQLIIRSKVPSASIFIATTLYCADELIKNKKTTFGRFLRTQSMLKLVK